MYECVMGMSTAGQGCILADEMGLGKTIQSIALIWTLLSKFSSLPSPAPASVLTLSECRAKPLSRADLPPHWSYRKSDDRLSRYIDQGSFDLLPLALL